MTAKWGCLAGLFGVFALAGPALATITALHVSDTSLAIGDTYTSSVTDSIDGPRPQPLALTGELDPSVGSFHGPLSHVAGCDGLVCTQTLVQGLVEATLSPAAAPLFTTQICNEEPLAFRAFIGNDTYITEPATLTERCRTLSGHVYDQGGAGKPDVYLWIEVQVPNNYLHANPAFVVPTFVPNGNSAWYPNASGSDSFHYPLLWGFVAKTGADGSWSAVVPNVVDGAKLNPSSGGDLCHDHFFGISAPPSCGDYLGYAVAPLASLLLGHNAGPYGELSYEDTAGQLQTIDSKILAQRGDSTFLPFYRDSISVQGGDVDGLNFNEIPPPSLEITSVTLNPTDPHPGDEIAIDVTVHNNGFEEVGSVTPSLSFGGSDAIGGIALDDPVSATLAPDASVVFHYFVSAAHAEPLVAARLRASGTSTVTRRSVQAPLFFREFEITGSDFAVTLVADPTSPSPGEEFTITATISNLTDQDFHDLSAVTALAAKPADGVTIGAPMPATIPSLPAGGDPVTMEWAVQGASGRVKFTTTIGGYDAGDNLVTQQARATVTVGMPQLTWEIEPRFRSAADIADTTEQANPESYWLRATIKKADGSACDPSFGARFKIGGEEIDAGRTAENPCTYRFERENLDPFDLDLELTREFEVVDEATVHIEAKDYLIASLGDSLSSGEGVPAGVDGWSLAQCDRSINAGPAQAALQLEESDPHSAITFVHQACSGATTEGGILGSYKGVRPSEGPLRAPQATELRRIAGGRKVDALVMSIGINDLQFSKAITQCFPPGQDCGGSAAQLLLGDFLAQRVAGLPGSYASVASELTSLGIGASNVFLLEYPDPSRDELLDFCDASFFDFGSIGPSEWSWLNDHLLLPLNSAGAQGAGEAAWQRIGGLAAAFGPHGLCAGDSWMTQLGETFALEGDKNGAFHPNYIGHAIYASYIYSALHGHLSIGGGEDEDLPTQVRFDTIQGVVQIEVSNDRFGLGDRVTINPGAPNQETRTIVGKGSLIFDAPLAFAHRAYEPILLTDTLPEQVRGNHAPIPYDDSAMASCDALTFIDVLANDLDIDEGDALDLYETDASLGQIVWLPGHPRPTIQYAPMPPGFTGETFTYRVRDLYGASTQATVTVLPAAEGPCELEPTTTTSTTSTMQASTTTLASTTTTLSQGSTTTTVTTTTNTVTTTTLLPPRAERLAGVHLLLADKAGNASKRKFKMKLAAPGLGLGARSGDDPSMAGATLRVSSDAGGFTATYLLPAANWKPRIKKGLLDGWIYSDKDGTDGPIASVMIRGGKLLRANGKGAGLMHELGADPAPVGILLEIGDGGLLYCARFGGETKFKAGKRFTATEAAAPQAAECAGVID